MKHTYLVERLSDSAKHDGPRDRGIGHVVVWQQRIRAVDAITAFRLACELTCTLERAWKVKAIDEEGLYAQALHPDTDPENVAHELVSVGFICKRGAPCCARLR